MNTIKAKSYSKVQEEYIAKEAITPGHLVQLHSNGKVQKHADEDGNAVVMFAFEDELQGKTIDDAYVTDNPVQVWVPYRGDQVNALLNHGENVVAGTFLVSAGNGCLKAIEDPTSMGNVETMQIVGMALEPMNATAAEKRIIIMVV